MDNKFTPLRQKSLSTQVIDHLLALIENGTYPPGSKFPQEIDLAREFDVSRSTIRGALSVLETRGIIKRIHGKGTFVSHMADFISEISNPLNEVLIYDDIVRQIGLELQRNHIKSSFIVPEAHIQHALNLEPGEEAFKVEKEFRADGAPIIYSVTIFPKWVYAPYFSDEEILQPDITWPLFDFLEKKLDQRTEYFLGNVRPVLASEIDTIDQSAINVEPNRKFLEIEETAYNDLEQPIFYLYEYLIGDKIKFGIRRMMTAGRNAAS
jgi:GntR family transcriptional regulator